MRPPAFWNHDGGAIAPTLLAPFAAITAAATARRVARAGWHAPVPVICCGNASVGGSGKTTLALDLGRRLLARGVSVAFLTRGYGGHHEAALRVERARHDSQIVGDEAMLLSAAAATYVSGDRAEAARLAIADGARVLVMDDGLQNPTLQKSMSLLVVDGAAGFGNRRVMPAGPLRETLVAAAARCRACVLIGEDATGALAGLPGGLAILRASLRSRFHPSVCDGRALIAFAGIGRPEKFFASLEAAGARLIGRHAFPDHHVYAERELRPLLAEATRRGAVVVTTPKDGVRLPMTLAGRIRTIDVALVWRDPGEVEALLDEVLAA